MQQPIDILERYWNYHSFKPQQEGIIDSILNGHDTFALLPTGGGKSVCYQVPALLKEGICIVISPLIALMKDQVNSLKKKGIKAIALTSGIPYQELDSLLDNCIYGNYKFLYLSPERLQQDLVRDRIKQMHVSFIAVDEAHCISQWGHDFRPAYKNIGELRQVLPAKNLVALTASATPQVVDDIITELDMIQPKLFRQSFNRPNLAYMVFDEADKLYRIERILKKNPQSSIIYVRSRKLCVEVSSFLERKGFSSTFFHGGISNEDKEQRLNDWLNNKKRIMVATNAFGMGIDKPDVKTVIHINLPESLESYFQEAGRAGRNGAKAFAVIIKSKGDESVLKHQFLRVLPSIVEVKTVYRKLCNYFQISYGEGEHTTHDFSFKDFCETYGFNSMTTYNALQILDRNSLISMHEQFRNTSELQFIVSSDYLFSYLETHPELSIITKTVLRTYGGVFDLETKIGTEIIAKKIGMKEQQVIGVLKTLEKDAIIHLKLSKTDTQITFVMPREDDKAINRIAKIIDAQNQLKIRQIDSVISYINNDSVCKSIQLLSYFGEQNLEPCGICSVCIRKKTNTQKSDTNIKEIILDILHVTDLSSRALSERIQSSESTLQKALQEMLEDGIIDITKTNTYKLK